MAYVLYVDCGFFELHNKEILTKASKIVRLKKNDVVKVYGMFQTLPGGTIRESSPTTSSGIIRPTFGVIYSAVAPAGK